jgi:hypothetical protein
VQVEESPVWTKAGTSCLVREDGWIPDEFGLQQSVADPNLYYHIVGDECLILVLYVDDLFLTCSERLIVECKRALISKFEMKDLGMIHYFLGLEVW